MKFANRARPMFEEAQLPLTSLIDVVFLLLIYFIVTTTLTRPEADLTSSLQVQREGSSRAADFEPQIIDVRSADGQPVFQIGSRVMRTQAQLTEILTSLPKEGGVFLRVDDAARVEGAAQAWQSARDAGFGKVSYVTPR